ncbi:MAG: hypothetical protein Tsb0015_14450 [Simkaniaceae bacterium]
MAIKLKQRSELALTEISGSSSEASLETSSDQKKIRLALQNSLSSKQEEKDESRLKKRVEKIRQIEEGFNGSELLSQLKNLQADLENFPKEVYIAPKEEKGISYPMIVGKDGRIFIFLNKMEKGGALKELVKGVVEKEVKSRWGKKKRASCVVGLKVKDELVNEFSQEKPENGKTEEESPKADSFQFGKVRIEADHVMKSKVAVCQQMGDKKLLLEVYSRYDFDLQSVAESKEVSFDQALKMLILAGKGIEEMHEKGFLHRDIKPANIMVKADKKGKVKKVKVADFDTAVRMEDQKALGHFSRVGSRWFLPIAFQNNDIPQSVISDGHAFAMSIKEVMKEKRFSVSLEKRKALDAVIQEMLVPAAYTPGSKKFPALKEVIFKLEKISAMK